jgi:large subunit ribosomal protein LP1/large subunit ribosomal protein LP2
MDKLTGEQKAEYATLLAALAINDGGADITSNQINTLLEATGIPSSLPTSPSSSQTS